MSSCSFGSVVVVKAQVQSDNAQDATQMGDAIKMLASLAAMQASNEPALANLAQSLQVTTNGAAVNLQISLPEVDLEQIVKPNAKAHPATRSLHPR